MKILIISQYFWPENFRINDLALGLKRRGHEVTILTGIPNYPGGKFYRGHGFFSKEGRNYHGMKVIRVPLIPRGNGGVFPLFLNYLSFALSASIIAPFACRGKIDLFFVFEPSPVTVGLPAVVMKVLKSAPIMFWVQDLWPESLSATGAVKSKCILAIIKYLVKFIYGSCDHILVQSKAFIPNIEALGIKNSKISYFPNWAGESQECNQDQINNSFKHAIPSGFRLMFAGNIGVAQDFNSILSAMERLKKYSDIHLIILGEGRLSGWVKHEIIKRDLKNNVHLFGQKPLKDMPSYFSLADALLVTLKSDPIFTLTIPNKVQSYLAFGKPIIAALDGEGARVINESGAGFTSASSNADALAKSIFSIYKREPGVRREIGLNGMRYYRAHFEYNMLMNRLDNLMLKICGQEKR